MINHNNAKINDIPSDDLKKKIRKKLIALRDGMDISKKSEKELNIINKAENIIKNILDKNTYNKNIDNKNTGNDTIYKNNVINDFSGKKYIRNLYIFAYRAKGNEVDLIQLIKKLWNKEIFSESGYTYIQLAFPKIENKKMEFYTAASEDDFAPGHFGILEPVIQNDNVHKIDFKALATDKNNTVIVLVPGVGFSKNGHRMGYGAGYYDRYFEGACDFNNVVLVGIAFDFQIYDIPYDSYDIIMEYMATDQV